LKKIFIFIVLVLLSFVTQAQFMEPGPCEVTPPWEKIKVSTGDIPENGSRIFVISNRPYNENPLKGEYFPNDIATWRKVSYFIATCDGSEWQLTIIPDFATGMNIINDGKNMLLFVEGHGKTLPMALNRAFQVKTRYDVSMIVFDWPSKNSNFNTSLARVRRCGDNFYNLLLQIREYKTSGMRTDQRFSIFAHSLGNYFFTNMVICGDAQYLPGKFIDNIVLNAAAIRTKQHGQVLSQIRFAERIYITSNHNDFVLRGAHLLTGGRMLGNMVVDDHADNAEYVDFTEVAGREHSYYFGFHGFEHQNPGFFYFYNSVFQGEKVDFRSDYFNIESVSGKSFPGKITIR
jgi:hypothetical protein